MVASLNRKRLGARQPRRKRARRLLLFHKEGAGRFRAQTLVEGSPVHTVRVADLNGDEKPDVLAVGARSIEWWENRTYRRR